MYRLWIIDDCAYENASPERFRDGCRLRAWPPFLFAALIFWPLQICLFQAAPMNDGRWRFVEEDSLGQARFLRGSRRVPFIRKWIHEMVVIESAGWKCLEFTETRCRIAVVEIPARAMQSAGVHFETEIRDATFFLQFDSVVDNLFL